MVKVEKKIEPTILDREIFREIFKEHWDEFKKRYSGYDTEQYNEVVEKMMGCGKEMGGYTEYICMKCGQDSRRVAFTCKGSFCLSCAKVYVDEFVEQVSRVLIIGVIYRHVILTVPKQLRKAFYRSRSNGTLLTKLMKCGYECLEDVIKTVKRQEIKIGIIVVVQTHGRSGKYNPHLHIILTNGGIKEKTGRWVDLNYFPYEVIHKKWKYHLFKMLKEQIATEEMKELINELWKKYPNGLVAHVTKGKVPESCRGLAKYLAKYVASPPIAVRRIIRYDGKEVTYWYKDHETNAKKVETVGVYTFIGRMVQHILPKGFQRIRYYGLQATKTYKKWREVIKKALKSIGKVIQGAYQVVSRKNYRERYKEIRGRDPMICRKCGGEMEVWRIWHPDYGTVYDELEKIMAGKYEREEGREGRGGDTVWSSAGILQLSMF